MSVEEVAALGRAVRSASTVLSHASTAMRNRLLRNVVVSLRANEDHILAINREEVSRAGATGLSPVLLDRLTFTPKGYRQMITGVKEVIALPDPVGEVLEKVKRPGGLFIEKIRVPLGAVGIIYEARPNVTVDAAALCLKAGNAVLLRGGSEAVATNRALVALLRDAVVGAGLPPDCVSFIDSTDRADVLAMIQQAESLDVVIPRGGKELISFIRANALVPVIAHGDGNCHVFVDASADLAMAEAIVINAKTQRPSVCNAAEKLLVHKRLATKFVPRIVRRLRDAGVEVLGDDQTRALVPDVVPAADTDWTTEYLAMVIAVKIVDDLGAAIAHINTYGSHHSDAIVTRTARNADKFLREVDSAAVYVNASTRFTDGFEFGLGAEIGISTQKLHARGPMGLRELTSYKWVVRGKGNLRG